MSKSHEFIYPVMAEIMKFAIKQGRLTPNGIFPAHPLLRLLHGPASARWLVPAMLVTP